MRSKNCRRSFLNFLFPLALMLQGCSAMAPSYMDDLQASLISNNVSPGSNHGELEDVHRLYRNRQYASALDGANFLLQNNSLSYNDRWVEFREAYLLRYRSNVALGNYQDARRDYQSLSELEWFEPAKVNGYLAVANSLDGSDTTALVNRLASLSASAAGTAGLSTSLAGSPNWDDLIVRAEASYFEALVFIQLGDIENSKAHFKTAQEKYRQAKIDMDGVHGVETYVTATDSYLSIIETYLAVLNDMSENKIASLTQLRAEAYYDPKAGSLIFKNWNWDMPFDPFLVDTSVTALENWSFVAGEGAEQMIADLIQKGRYLEAYAQVGKIYRSARLDESVHQLVGIMSAYTPSDMTEQARRYLAQANVYIERRDYRQGASAYLQVIEQSPWVVDAYYNLAQIYAAAQNYPNAIRTMEHFLILSPDGPRKREATDSIYTWEVSSR